MSALGHERTFHTLIMYVRFAPESGHLSAWGGREDFEYTP